MVPISTTLCLPKVLWRAAQRLATHEGDANEVVIRALEEYLPRAGPWVRISFTRRRKGFGSCGIVRSSGMFALGSSHAAVIDA